MMCEAYIYLSIGVFVVSNFVDSMMRSLPWKKQATTLSISWDILKIKEEICLLRSLKSREREHDDSRRTKLKTSQPMHQYHVIM